MAEKAARKEIFPVMKKNTMMRIASVLLIAVLLSTCTISGTFAKYVTEASGSDSARVAKWGVTVTANGSTFADKYDKDDESFTAKAWSVYTSNGDNLVAPGTEGEMVSMTLSGQPEVATRVTYTVDTFDLSGWNVGGKVYYCPICINVNGTWYYGQNYENEAAFEAEIKNAIEKYSKDYEANTNLANAGADSLTVSWKWAFTKGTDGLSHMNSDEYDTALGNQAANDQAAKIELKITTTVTQID